MLDCRKYFSLRFPVVVSDRYRPGSAQEAKFQLKWHSSFHFVHFNGIWIWPKFSSEIKICVLLESEGLCLSILQHRLYHDNAAPLPEEKPVYPHPFREEDRRGAGVQEQECQRPTRVFAAWGISSYAFTAWVQVESTVHNPGFSIRQPPSSLRIERTHRVKSLKVINEQSSSWVRGSMEASWVNLRSLVC